MTPANHCYPRLDGRGFLYEPRHIAKILQNVTEEGCLSPSWPKPQDAGGNKMSVYSEAAQMGMPEDFYKEMHESYTVETPNGAKA